MGVLLDRSVDGLWEGGQIEGEVIQSHVCCTESLLEKKKKIILHDIRHGIFVMFIRCYIMVYAEFLKGTIEKISLSINEPKLKKNSIH